MAPKAKNAAYAALVAEAETAVAAVKDPELRRVAFEKILTTLLEGATTAAPAGRAKREKRVSSQVAGGGGGKASATTRSGPKLYVQMLIDEGFFKKQRTLAEVKAELANRAHHVAITSLSGPMGRLTQERRLRRQKVSANSKGTKTTYAYSNW
jgi:hypothetical protein